MIHIDYLSLSSRCCIASTVTSNLICERISWQYWRRYTLLLSQYEYGHIDRLIDLGRPHDNAWPVNLILLSGVSVLLYSLHSHTVCVYVWLFTFVYVCLICVCRVSASTAWPHTQHTYNELTQTAHRSVYEKARGGSHAGCMVPHMYSTYVTRHDGALYLWSGESICENANVFQEKDICQHSKISC